MKRNDIARVLNDNIGRSVERVALDSAFPNPGDDTCIHAIWRYMHRLQYRSYTYRWARLLQELSIGINM